MAVKSFKPFLVLTSKVHTFVWKKLSIFLFQFVVTAVLSYRTHNIYFSNAIGRASRDIFFNTAFKVDKLYSR